MRYRTISFLLCLLTSTQLLAFEAKTPNSVEASRLISMAKTRKTADGATIIEVLHYVEKLRPKEFKIAGGFDFGYDYQGQLVSVGVCYWMGAKRSKGDEYCDISWSISKDRKSISPSTGALTGDAVASLTIMRLEAGRDAFLRNIDDFYASTCVDQRLHKKYC